METTDSIEYRIEHDLIGDAKVPQSAYYGVQTQRAVDNFPITGIRLNHYAELPRAIAMVKKACALANRDVGMLDAEKAGYIAAACDEIIEGKLHDQFVVDMVQGGAGTSTNMNGNDVICNRALELMGHKKGEYQYLHPNNHVNMAQSTNDAYPTSIRLSMVLKTDHLIESLKNLKAIFDAKADEFKDVLKVGRTQLMDAVPMTLGQEFRAFADTLGEDLVRLKENVKLLCEMNLGATAIGTGITADCHYAPEAIKHLTEVSGHQMILASDLIEATSDMGAFVMYSSTLKRLAVKLSKISNDLRLLASGPFCGLHEINLPDRQPGSTIMPGKVNPVIPECMSQISYHVIGNDVTVTMCSEAAQLQLNAMEPMIAFSILDSIQQLSNGMDMLGSKCVKDITANPEICMEYVERSVSLVTALNPYIGYENSTRIARTAMKTGEKVIDLVRKENLLSDEQLAEILKPENMIAPINLAKVAVIH
ncbi:Aspartate ammonia-lyase [invertebrate metagenome]|uniref:Aspartate ammonia-lyase n=1 Tax=invertebrate metagenome TaxID=1711999 RepID=A0A2H9TC62_9ZZZZ